MTQEIRDLIYNKTAEQLNKDEVDYIYSLLKKKSAGFNFWFTAIVGPLMGVLVPIVLNLPLGTTATYFDVLPVTTILGTFSGLILGGMFHSMAPSLKTLGLSRKDWKELKKSGRLKELNKIVKLYEQSDKSYLDDLAEIEEEISSEIQLKEEEKQSLINELVNLYAEKRAITGEEKTTKYTQEYVAELLKSEENLLMRRLNQLKQEQKMLQENANNETLTESGKRSEQSIDYMKQALKNCQEFNEEFKAETFDN